MPVHMQAALSGGFILFVCLAHEVRRLGGSGGGGCIIY